MERPRIGVLGAGPKAMAIAAKAKVLSDAGMSSVDLYVVDRHSTAANWTGASGFTDGEQALGTPPEKDIGFPYASGFGKFIDTAMLPYSWQAFRVARGDYHGWIDRGKPAPTHRQWAQYLNWVASSINLSVEIGQVQRVAPRGTGWDLLIDKADGSEALVNVDALVLTGPGEAIRLPGSANSERILDGRSFWQRKELFRHLRGHKGETPHVAVIGSGETAASIVLAITRTMPELKIDLINRHGTIYTRGESYHENSLYTNPQKWLDMEEIEREEFISRTDRGVFSVEAQRLLDHMGAAPNIFILTGNVVKVTDIGGQVQVILDRRGKHTGFEYEYVIVAIGFDPLSVLDLLPEELRKGEWLRLLRKTMDVDEHMRVSLPLGDNGTTVRSTLHMPMIAGLHQGPGFPNLSCLGTLADRILSCYVSRPAEIPMPDRFEL